MKIEVLEPRQLLASASISGTVFYDSDASKNQDAREPGLAGWTVYIDSNDNGQFDTGEPTALTDRKGRYTFGKLAAGDYQIGVVDQNNDYQTSPSASGAVRSQFRIALAFAKGMSADVRRDFVEAEQRWESIITGQPVSVDPRATSQTLTISANVQNIDGQYGILGQSQPTSEAYDTGIPIKGGMEFDRSDIQPGPDGLSFDGTDFQSTVLHEMGHVLGFGTIWDVKDLISSTHNHKPRFTGAKAEAAYKALFGAADTTGYVPVDGTGGDGTANAHWNESIFQEELMTGYADETGRTVPLSTITVAQFADEGYTVNMKAADDWNPVKHQTIKTTALKLGAKAGEQKITVGAGQAQVVVNFGYRAAETAPTFKANVTSATKQAGDIVTLSTANISDAEGDSVGGVTYYKESNGTPGLQTGRGGDLYVGFDSTANKGTYSITAPSDATASSDTYYAKVSDGVGYSRLRTISISLQGSESVSSHFAVAQHITADSALNSGGLAQTFGLTTKDLLL